MEISKEEYPYEAYCVNCSHVFAYLKTKPCDGEPVMAQNAINLDGTLPKPGDHIEHAGEMHVAHYQARERK